MKIACPMVFAALIAATSPALANVVNQAISEEEVLDAQSTWCQALVDISSTHAESDQAAAQVLAEEVIDAAYGYQIGPVLFKPTLTLNPQTFRTTRAGALAYFQNFLRTLALRWKVGRIARSTMLASLSVAGAPAQWARFISPMQMARSQRWIKRGHSSKTMLANCA